jgi:tRNA pseudouridine13 synthase
VLRRYGANLVGVSDMNNDFGQIYLTGDLAGTGGRLREEPEDFVVEEVPIYEPSGQGSFAFLLVEAVNLSTLDLVALIRRRLALHDHEIGLAGWKDKHAITRQWVSVPRGKVTEESLERLAGEGLRVLKQKGHVRKLRTGHLLGNRFSILIREVQPEAEELAGAVVQRLQACGLPNFYGPQRFGIAGDNAEKGLALLRGETKIRSVRTRKLLISASASLLFNLTLRERLERGLYGRLLQGDVAKKHSSGGLFVVEDPTAEQGRADRLEISAPRPIWGKKMMQAREEAGVLEAEILKRRGLKADLFHRQPGSRRALRVPLGDVTIRREAAGLRLEFFLPKGSYATVLLGEVMKT